MSKLQFQYNKKQIPQIVGLAVLSTGMLGYFSLKMITPPPPERAVAAVKMIAKSKATDLTLTSTDVQMAMLTNGPPPSPTMQDPFLPSTAATTAANTSVGKPQINIASAGLPTFQHAGSTSTPYLGLIKPLAGLGHAAPGQALVPIPVAWTVTGVLNASSGGKNIAVLRSGAERRFVALGGMVDDQCRLIGVDRFGVTLMEGKSRVRLVLGGDKKAAAPDALAAQPAVQTVSAPASTPATLSAAINAAAPIAAAAASSATAGDTDSSASN
jgi:hypothetical protein